MKRILTVIGARPQFIKAAALSRAIRESFSERIEELILHTGQHYDTSMSEVFFEELSIPRPDVLLDCGGKSQGKQTALMLDGIEQILTAQQIDAVVVYGDTNSTLAGALAAVKLHIPVVHIEAGLRSFNKSMPEEINRITCDHCSTLLFSPTDTGIANLVREGFSAAIPERCTVDAPGAFRCGDVMYDNSLHFAAIAEEKYRIADFGIGREFALVTIHRPYNADKTDRLKALLDDLSWLASARELDVVLPLHPRTRNQLEKEAPEALEAFKAIPGVKLIEPVSFLEMTFLEKNSRMIITDSGGVQKEAFFFHKPSVVIRTETEWVELVELGAAELSFETGEAMRAAFDRALGKEISEWPSVFGDGNAAAFICEQIDKRL